MSVASILTWIWLCQFPKPTCFWIWHFGILTILAFLCYNSIHQWKRILTPTANVPSKSAMASVLKFVTVKHLIRMSLKISLWSNVWIVFKEAPGVSGTEVSPHFPSRLNLSLQPAVHLEVGHHLDHLNHRTHLESSLASQAAPAHVGHLPVPPGDQEQPHLSVKQSPGQDNIVSAASIAHK